MGCPLVGLVGRHVAFPKMLHGEYLTLYQHVERDRERTGSCARAASAERWLLLLRRLKRPGGVESCAESSGSLSEDLRWKRGMSDAAGRQYGAHEKLEDGGTGEAAVILSSAMLGLRS